MKSSHINEMRLFNRFYTSVIGALGKNFLNSPYSLPEIRVLFTIGKKDGVTASEVMSVVNIDKGYLSRIILKFKKKKMLIKKTAPNDGRSSNLYLTAAGRKELSLLDNDANLHVKQILVQLTDKEVDLLTNSMRQIREILSSRQYNRV